MSTSKIQTRTTSVRVSPAVIQMAQESAALNGRSVSAQVDYWARLGKAVEAEPSFSHDRVQAALSGQLSRHKLNPAEHAYYIEHELDWVWKERSPEDQAAFAAEIKATGGCGVDDKDRLVRFLPNGEIEVLVEDVDNPTAEESARIDQSLRDAVALMAEKASHAQK